MAIALKRPGRMVDYFVEGTSQDVTAATVGDFEAAIPMRALCESEALPLPPVPAPVYEHRPRVKRGLVALAVSLVVNVVLLEVVVRFVVGAR